MTFFSKKHLLCFGASLLCVWTLFFPGHVARLAVVMGVGVVSVTQAIRKILKRCQKVVED